MRTFPNGHCTVGRYLKAMQGLQPLRYTGTDLILRWANVGANERQKYEQAH
jgi:hypothetical protein